MNELAFIRVNSDPETWVNVAHIALVQDTPTGCEIRVLNDVGWTSIKSMESAASLMESIRQAMIPE